LRGFSGKFEPWKQTRSQSRNTVGLAKKLQATVICKYLWLIPKVTTKTEIIKIHPRIALKVTAAGLHAKFTRITLRLSQ
jgi:hypothetical protein